MRYIVRDKDGKQVGLYITHENPETALREYRAQKKRPVSKKMSAGELNIYFKKLRLQLAELEAEI